jgi:hypothetical protein
MDGSLHGFNIYRMIARGRRFEYQKWRKLSLYICSINQRRWRNICEGTMETLIFEKDGIVWRELLFVGAIKRRPTFNGEMNVRPRED